VLFLALTGLGCVIGMALCKIMKIRRRQQRRIPVD
jgi:hypothetical protein